MLLALSAVFIAYILSGILAGPDWSAAFRGLIVPSLPRTRDALVITTATVGTTLAPWGLSFIQSYAADKRLTPNDLRYERVDVVIGATLTGIIGLFVVVACAATLHRKGIVIHDAADAALALHRWPAGWPPNCSAPGWSAQHCWEPRSCRYRPRIRSANSSAGRPPSTIPPREAPLFYSTYGAVTTLSATLVLVPGAPLIPILVLTQVLNAVLLLPLLAFMLGVARERDLMGDRTVSRVGAAGYLLTIAFIAACVAALAVLSLP